MHIKDFVKLHPWVFRLAYVDRMMKKYPKSSRTKHIIEAVARIQNFGDFMALCKEKKLSQLCQPQHLSEIDVKGMMKSLLRNGEFKKYVTTRELKSLAGEIKKYLTDFELKALGSPFNKLGQFVQKNRDRASYWEDIKEKAQDMMKERKREAREESRAIERSQKNETGQPFGGHGDGGIVDLLVTEKDIFKEGVHVHLDAGRMLDGNSTGEVHTRKGDQELINMPVVAAHQASSPFGKGAHFAEVNATNVFQT